MRASLKLAAVAIAGVVVGTTGLRVLRAQATPHAFLVAEVDVKDTAAYREYVQGVTPIVTKFGGHYIARGGKTESFEGAKAAGRVALIEFPSLAALDRFETSAEYAKVAAIRRRAATSRIYAVEGVAP